MNTTLAFDNPPVDKRPSFIAVATVEDDSTISSELASLINSQPDLACVCSCRNFRGALIKIPRCVPDVILMDLSLPDGSGTECAVRLKRSLPFTRIIAFTVEEDDEHLFAALRCGFSGYLLKRCGPERIIHAIREVAEGGAPLTPQLAAKVVKSFHRDQPGLPPVGSSELRHPGQLLKFEALTRREGEVLEFLAQGFHTKQISQQLSITAGTVASHLKHIYEKLQVRSRTEAVIKYLRR